MRKLWNGVTEFFRRGDLILLFLCVVTTIFGMVPLLFSFDMGSELQKPLAIAMISAMLIGTAVSLFIIPLVYKYGS